MSEIRPEWHRIAGIQVQEDGTIAAVWMARDSDTDTIHLYDCALFKREVLPVVSEGINARGRWIPIAWHKDAEDIAEKLLDRDVNVLPEPIKTSQSATEATALEIWGRMRSHRFKVSKRLGEWTAEYKTYYRQDSKVPTGSHPLMHATQHAVAALDYAMPQATLRKNKITYPKLAVI